MKMIRLAWQNIRHDASKSLLSILLMGLGLSLICFFLVSKRVTENNFRKNLAGIHLVLGAKGSPLQLVLCNLYHADVPTGNIKIDDAKAFLNPKHPLLERAVPVSLGDSYSSYRIVGTTNQFLDLYDLKLAEGRKVRANMEVVIGQDVSQALNLNIGDRFKSSHGIGVDESLTHQHNDQFEVVGILEKSGSVPDQLILCNPSSFWQVHDGHDHEEHEHNENNGHDHDNHDHDGHNHDHNGHDHKHDHGEHEHHDHHGHDHDHEHHDHSGHDHHHDHGEHEHHDHHGHDHDHEHHDHSGHDHHHDHGDHEHHDHHGHSGHEHRGHSHEPKYPNCLTNSALLLHKDKEITALLLQFKGKNIQSLNMLRSINENTPLMAASPSFELNKLFDQLGIGFKLLRYIAIMILIISGISIWFGMSISLEDRQYEMALIRSYGGTKSQLAKLILMEVIIIALIGYLVGMVMFYFYLYLANSIWSTDFAFGNLGLNFFTEQWWMLILGIGLAIVSTLIPLFRILKLDVVKTLSKQ